jgi:tight adherence protein B
MIRLAALIACAGMAAVFLFRAGKLRSRAAAFRRLEKHSAVAEVPETPPSFLLKTLGRLDRTRIGESAKAALSASGLRVTWGTFSSVWAWSLLFVPSLALLVTGSLLAVPPAVAAVLLLPPPVLRSLKGRTTRKLERQVDSFACDMSLYLRCGVPVEDAVVMCLEEAQPPLSGKLTETLTMLSFGSTEEALRSLAGTFDSPDLNLIVSAVMTSRQTGSDVGTIMAAVGESLRERSAIRRELSTQTVQARLSGKVVAALPLLFLGLSAVVSRKSLGVLFGTVPGIVMLVVAAALELVGFLWIRKILDIEV